MEILELVLTGIALLLTFIIMKRNKEVHDFRLKIIDMESDYNHKLIDMGIYKEKWYTTIYGSLPSYEHMVFKFWEPLELKTYLSESDIDKLRGNFSESDIRDIESDIREIDNSVQELLHKRRN